MNENNFCTQEKLKEICLDYPTPFRLYDADGIVNDVQKVYRAFSWVPKFKDYFVADTCPNPSIIKLLREEGCGARCASREDLYLAYACEIKGEDIIFSPLDLIVEDLRLADSFGAIISLDNAASRKFLAITLSGRLPGIIGCYCDFSDSVSAFRGMSEVSVDHVIERSRVFYRTKRFGLHLSMKASHDVAAQYAQAADQIFRLAIKLYRTKKISIDYIAFSEETDEGYYPEGHLLNHVSEISDCIRAKYEELLHPAGLDHVAIFTNLSRFAVKSHSYVITRRPDKRTQQIIAQPAGRNEYSPGHVYYGPRSAEILLYGDGSFKEIRRAESLKDYFETVPEVERFYTYRQPSKDFFEC